MRGLEGPEGAPGLGVGWPGEGVGEAVVALRKQILEHSVIQAAGKIRRLAV